METASQRDMQPLAQLPPPQIKLRRDVQQPSVLLTFSTKLRHPDL